jgi:hypothetical protein
MKQHLRNDKTCLNCGTSVEERYCTRCGQENVELKESFGYLVSHFFSDFTHYDSKFFITIKDLLFNPGFLTKEYMAGKRTNYLHPIRMYLFISFLYFLVVFTFNDSGHKVEEFIAQRVSYDTKKEITDIVHNMLFTASKDTAADSRLRESVIQDILIAIRTDSVTDKRNFNIQLIGNIDYKRLREYDSLQNLLPLAKKEKGVIPWLYHRWLTTINYYGEGTIDLMVAKTNHFVPKMMFFLLPLFGVLLKLFYNRKKYFYVDHAIFSLHFHSAVFLLFLVFAGLELLFPSLSPYFSIMELLFALVYLVIALRNTYQQSALISVFKSTGLVLIYSVFIIAGFVVVSLSAIV